MPPFKPESPGVQTPESRGDKERGANVKVHNIWIRHAQKSSGEVFQEGDTAISASGITEQGAADAQDLGREIDGGKHGARGYVTNIDRTTETLDSVLRGYREKNPGKPIRGARIREQLLHEYPPGFSALYKGKIKRGVAEQLGEGQKLEDLSADEQERIAEEAEEPIAREWLDNPESKLAELYPPEDAAADFAVLFNRRHERLAERLNDGSELDLIHVTHKTMTEPFLASGVLIEQDTGESVTRIEKLGGTLGILDKWESEVVTDEQGEARSIVRVRGADYNINQDRLAELVEKGQARKNEARQKARD